MKKIIWWVGCHVKTRSSTPMKDLQRHNLGGLRRVTNLTIFANWVGLYSCQLTYFDTTQSITIFRAKCLSKDERRRPL